MPAVPDHSLFIAEPAADGTDAVLIRVDPITALQVAASWEHVHRAVPVNAAARPTYLLDSAALRRAAADATVLAHATAQMPRGCQITTWPNGSAAALCGQPASADNPKICDRHAADRARLTVVKTS